MEKNDNIRRYVLFSVSAVLLIIAAYGGLILYLVWPISEFSISKAGTFGDSFGAVSCLFSGLAFAGVLITIRMQRDELAESRNAFRIERFEDSFYRLLELYRKNLDEIKLTDVATGRTCQGVDALKFVCSSLSEKMQFHAPLLEVEGGHLLYEAQLFVEVQRTLGKQARYLGSLQALLETIERDLLEHERQRYWKLLANQLTSVEAKYLFFCCLVSHKTDELRELVHRSGLIAGRLASANISQTLRALYFKTHGIVVAKPRVELVMPYSRNELRKLRKARRVAGDTITGQ